MKNIFIKLFSTFFLAFLLIPSSFGQRNFVMVHGLGGGLKSQAPYANLFALRAGGTSVNPINFEHNSADGIVAAATDATIKATNLSAGRSVTNRANDIGIGHSMGGLTVREMDRQATQPNGTKMFGGFIITGPPIHGSRLPTSFQDGSVNNFFNGLCKEVILDPLLSLISGVSAALGGFGFANIINVVQNWDSQICNLLFQLVQSSDTFKGFQTSSINDFSMNANYLDNPTTGINSFTSTTHKVCFMGNENGPVHWRLFSSFMKTPNDGTLHDGSHDQIGVNLMNDIEDIELFTGIAASITSFACCFNFETWYLVQPFGNMGYQFLDGYFWFQQSESQYNNVIGAYGSFTELQDIEIFDCYGQRGTLEQKYQSGQISMSQYWQGVSALYANPNCTRHEKRNVIIPLNGESDGVVPLKSQSLEGAANFVLDGVNHFELRDHPKVTLQYNQLFSRNLNLTSNAAQQFFFTP
jgi:hypothetical protein